MSFRETLARKFKPAGFEQPEGSRHEYTKPRPELQEAFYQWVRELPEGFSVGQDEILYEMACELVKSFAEIPYKEANGLLVDFKPKTDGQQMVGLFISACYNYSPEQVIIFDVDAPGVWSVGYKLPENKALVNRGRVDWGFGRDSLGILINNAEVGEYFGGNSEGIVINNGKIEVPFVQNKGRGIELFSSDAGYYFCHMGKNHTITLEDPEDYVKSLGDLMFVLKPAKRKKTPQLKMYLEELRDLTKSIKDEESVKIFLERYGPKPKERIDREVLEILELEGIDELKWKMEW